MCSPKYIYHNIHKSSICNSLRLKPTQVSKRGTYGKLILYFLSWVLVTHMYPVDENVKLCSFLNYIMLQ